MRGIQNGCTRVAVGQAAAAARKRGAGGREENWGQKERKDVAEGEEMRTEEMLFNAREGEGT